MLIIAHLSDFHIRDNTSFDESFYRSISSAIKAETKESDVLYLICTGDVAFSGKISEYDNALKIFEIILDGNTNFICCPGNHDIDYQNNAVRSAVIKSILEDGQSIDYECISTCLKSQENYFIFDSQLTNKDWGNNINIFHKIKYKSYTILFNIINTAFTAELDSPPGKIFLDPIYLDTSCYNANLKIAIMHHTLSWFQEKYRVDIRKVINKNYEFVFTGHEHKPDAYCSGPFNNDTTSFIEGGEINVKGSHKNSDFNIIKLDLENEQFANIVYVYDEKDQIFRRIKGHEDQWSQIMSIDYSRNYLEFSKKFVKFLDGPGAPYNHPRKDSLVLSDFYIFPNLKELDASKKKDIKVLPTIRANKIVNKKFGTLAISGGEKSGKTALAKMLCSMLKRLELLPIYINCEELTKSQGAKLDEVVLKSYTELYKDCDLDNFKQILQHEAVIILDDFHLLQGNNFEKAKALRKMASLYNNFVVFATDDILFTELKYIENNKFKNKERYLNTLERYSIMPFGYVLREELIKKWYNLSDDDIDYSWESSSKLDELINKIELVVDHNFVPSYPFYLLTALATIDTMATDEIVKSAYGHYYQALLTMTLSKIDKTQAEIGLRITFLTNFAIHLYQQKASRISTQDFDVFFEKHIKKYGISLDKNVFTDQLIDASLFQSIDGVISFKYKYFFYYFVANYLSHNINSEDSKIKIKELISTLYKESSGCILMFLVHFSTENSFILEEILSHARSLFKNSPIATIDDDATHFKELAFEIEQVILPNITPSEIRKKSGEEFDKNNNRTDKDFSSESIKFDELEPKDSSERFIADMAASFKCMSIIGQILKSYYGSLISSQKYSLFEEAVSISFRTLGDYYEFVKKYKQEMIEDISKIIKNSNITEPSKIKNRAKRYLLDYSSDLSLFFILVPAKYLSSKKLKQTYKNFFYNHKDETSYKLLSLAIDIEYLHLLPVERIEDLAKDFRDNIMAFSILQRLIAFHMYMHHTTFKEKQRLTDLLKISMKQQRMIEQSSQEKKII